MIMYPGEGSKPNLFSWWGGKPAGEGGVKRLATASQPPNHAYLEGSAARVGVLRLSPHGFWNIKCNGNWIITPPPFATWGVTHGNNWLIAGLCKGCRINYLRLMWGGQTTLIFVSTTSWGRLRKAGGSQRINLLKRLGFLFLLSGEARNAEGVFFGFCFLWGFDKYENGR